MNPPTPPQSPLKSNINPRCLRCGSTSIKSTVTTTHLGNFGRPYFYCSIPSCNTFICFGDTRGIHNTNPPCDCDGFRYSRLQVAGPDTRIPHGLHFKCAVGGCDFFERAYDEEGRFLVFEGPIPGRKEMIARGF